MTIRPMKTIVLIAGCVGLAGCASTGNGPLAAPEPGTPKLVHPLSDAPQGETIYTSEPVLEWRPASHAEGYGVYVSEYNGEEWQLVYSSETETGGPIRATSLALPGESLADDGQYRWNTRAWNDRAGWGPYSASSEFTVELRTDAELHKLVHEHLDRAPNVQADNIEVAVTQGNVTLSGCVPTPDQQRYAHEVAHSIGGVESTYTQDLRTC